MKLKNIKSQLNIEAIIKEDSNAGFYLYIYDMKTGQCTHDYLQITLKDAKDQAEEEFGISCQDWIPCT